MKTKELYPFFILGLLFIFSRIYNLGSLPIFQDESSYVNLALKISHNPLEFWDESFLLPIAKPPLFLLIQAIFLKQIPNFILAARLVSVAAGLLSLIGIYFITKHLFSKSAAITASFLYIISPFTLFYDRLGIMESLLTTFFIWTIYFGINFNKAVIKYGTCTSLAIGLSILTKQTGVLVIPVLFVVHAAQNWRAWKKFSYGIFFLGVGFLISKVLAFSPNYSFLANFKPADLVDVSVDPFIKIFIKNIMANISWIKSYLSVPLIILFLFGFILLFKRKRRAFIILSSWLIIPIISQSAIAKNLFPRYFLIAFPPILIVISYFWDYLNFRLVFGKKLFYLSTLFILLPSLYFSTLILFNVPKAPLHYNEKWQYISNWPSGYGVKETSDFIEKNIDNKTVIYAEGSSGHLADTLGLYLRGYQVVSFDRDTIPTPSEEKYILVFNNRPGILSQNVNYKLIHSEAKPYFETEVEIYALEPHNLRVKNVNLR